MASYARALRSGYSLLMDVTADLQRLLDRAAVVETIVGIANALDLKEWPRVRSCLADELDIDYSEFRGEAPARISADPYVASREAGLRGVRSLHMSTNHEITIAGDGATCRSAYRIFRVAESDASGRLDTAGHYEHRLVRVGGRWLVTSITQTVVVLDGERSVHGAFRDENRDLSGATRPRDEQDED